jgi:hypothetical protein
MRRRADVALREAQGLAQRRVHRGSGGDGSAEGEDMTSQLQEITIFGGVIALMLLVIIVYLAYIVVLMKEKSGK